MKMKLDEHVKVLLVKKAIHIASLMDSYHKGSMLDSMTTMTSIDFANKLLHVVTTPTHTKSQEKHEHSRDE